MFCLIPTLTVFLQTTTFVVVVRFVYLFFAAFPPQLCHTKQSLILSYVCLPVRVKCLRCETCYEATLKNVDIGANMKAQFVDDNTEQTCLFICTTQFKSQM